MSIYKNAIADSTVVGKDAYSTDPTLTAETRGITAETLNFLTNNHIVNPEMWRRFVAQFTEHSDTADEGWRGEYWGKMMRGATLIYKVTRDPALYDVLRHTVEEMICTADGDGRISSYSPEAELKGWDLWCRKYVILGMEYFLEISRDEVLNARILSSIESQLNVLTDKIGDSADGKTPITQTSLTWRGLNSSSILEPVVRAYRLLGKKHLLDFASHIVGEGFTRAQNLIDLATENNTAPYQFPITKAYEMVSCFMGLLEYYKITGEERLKTAVINLASKILETDFTLTGGAGMGHELFDHSTVRQAKPDIGDTPQETCVTVTLMQLFSRLALLTGEVRFFDAFERSYYNAYLGAVNTKGILSPLALESVPDGVHTPLPFDSYSPLTAAPRGMSIGGFKVMPDKHYYGCCACIGSAGVGIAGRMTLLRGQDGPTFGLYIPGKYTMTLENGCDLSLDVETDYPANGKIKIKVFPQYNCEFPLTLRIPEWTPSATVSVCGSANVKANGMYEVKRTWNLGDEVVLDLTMPIVIHRPISYGSELLMNRYQGKLHFMLPNVDVEDPEMKYHVAFTRGPLVLTADEALNVDLDERLPFAINGETIDAHTSDAPFTCQAAFDLPLSDGRKVTLVDYASAGKDWSTRIAVWIKCK